MNLHQLRAVCEVVKRGLRMSTAATALYKSQPRISSQIKEIEDELGVRVFRRKKNKIEALTPAGREVIRVAERILRDFESLRLIGKEYSKTDVGELTIATTHTHARHSLPKVIESFVRQFPNVGVTIRQGNPMQCGELVAAGEADLAISTGTLQSVCDVVSLPVYRVARCIVARRDDPILKEKKLTLEKLANYPIIAFEAAFGGRQVVNEAFSDAGLKPRVVLTAVDADVSKAYVERGMGIAILAKVAFNPVKDKDLRTIDADHLFKSSVLNVSLRKQAYLRSYVLSFISLYAPHLPRNVVMDAVESADIDITRLNLPLPFYPS